MPDPATSFEAIYEQFQPKVVRLLRGFVGPDEADDLAQVAMMKVHEHLAGFRGESSLSTWIYRLATNVAVDRLRQRRARGDDVPAAIADDEDASCDTSPPPELRAPSTETTAIREEMGECVREFVDRLPAAYRGVLVLGDIEGFTNAEIGHVLGLSLDTVKIRLHRARLKLRAELSSGCRLEHDGRGELACDRRAVSHPVRILSRS